VTGKFTYELRNIRVRRYEWAELAQTCFKKRPERLREKSMDYEVEGIIRSRGGPKKT